MGRLSWPRRSMFNPLRNDRRTTPRMPRQSVKQPCCLAKQFIKVNSEEALGAAMVFGVGELLLRLRTQANNGLRGHLDEFG